MCMVGRSVSEKGVTCARVLRGHGFFKTLRVIGYREETAQVAEASGSQSRKDLAFMLKKGFRPGDALIRKTTSQCRKKY